MRLPISDLKTAGQFDYCIIGSGPAGITCALELAEAGNRVALLEGGLDEYTDESQDLFKGEVIGDEYFELRDAHLRFFGGTSNHWAGFCKILDSIDFETKAGIPNTEWPIRKSDIDPYLNKALYCGGRISAGLEQAPLADNRIELSDELDALGMPRTVLYWKRTGIEMRSLQTVARSLADYLAKNNLGRVHYRPWVLDDQADFPDDNEEMAQHHHMGGTRMSDNPDLGVVDKNCKVFGQENLYLPGHASLQAVGTAIRPCRLSSCPCGCQST